MAADTDRKTTPHDGDVTAYLDAVPDERRRADALDAVDLIREVTGAEPRLWGDSIVGFGRQPYRTADGKEREWLAVGLAPRKAALTLYGLTYYGSNTDLLERLGPHSDPDTVDMETLARLKDALALIERRITPRDRA